MARWTGLLPAAALVALAGLLGAACGNGGGGDSPLEAYFRRVTDVDQAFQTTSEQIDVAMSGSQDLDEVRGLMGDTVTAFDEFIAGLEELDAPAEVQDPHGAAVAGLQAFRDALSAGVDETASATTVDEAFAAFDDLDYSGSEQAQAACQELEQIAADNGITVSLYCSGTGGASSRNAEPAPEGDALVAAARD